ncbi:MAG: isopropylmalate isomerase [Pikeienuella sp.]
MPTDMGAVWDCAMLRWRPAIGDPTLMGWLTVAGYFAAAALALFATRAALRGRDRAERLFWIACCAGFLFLGVNKQLDLQSLLTAIGRCVAQIQGWYEDRRAVQAEFILVILAACGALFAVFAWALRKSLRRNWLALLGAAMIAGFILVRAVGFHHVDAALGLRFGGWRLNWILELGGIAIFSLGALKRIAAPRAPLSGPDQSR